MSKELGFADVKYPEQEVIEVIPHDCVEITYENIQELQQLIGAGPDSKRILINCRKQHSYSFDAMRAMRELTGVVALATFSANKRKPSTADILRGDNRKTEFPFESFSLRKDALEWLLCAE